jgi:hypothetical protein
MPENRNVTPVGMPAALILARERLDGRLQMMGIDNYAMDPLACQVVQLSCQQRLVAYLHWRLRHIEAQGSQAGGMSGGPARRVHTGAPRR